MFVVSFKATEELKEYHDRAFKSKSGAFVFAQEMLEAGFIVKVTEVG